MVEIRKINGDITLGLLDLRVFSLKEGVTVKRDLERAGTRYLLQELLSPPGAELSYTPEKKPFLEGRTEHISISHSHDKLAIILNRRESTGIDIEQIRDKVIHIRHKFLNTAELEMAGEDAERLIALWAAKEALYKVYGLRELEFIRNLFIEELSDTEITGSIRFGDLRKRYRMRSEKIDNYRMVYVLNEL